MIAHLDAGLGTPLDKHKIVFDAICAWLFLKIGCFLLSGRSPEFSCPDPHSVSGSSDIHCVVSLGHAVALTARPHCEVVRELVFSLGRELELRKESSQESLAVIHAQGLMCGSSS